MSRWLPVLGAVYGWAFAVGLVILLPASGNGGVVDAIAGALVGCGGAALGALIGRAAGR